MASADALLRSGYRKVAGWRLLGKRLAIVLQRHRAHWGDCLRRVTPLSLGRCHTTSWCSTEDVCTSSSRAYPVRIAFCGRRSNLRTQWCRRRPTSQNKPAAGRQPSRNCQGWFSWRGALRLRQSRDVHRRKLEHVLRESRGDGRAMFGVLLDADRLPSEFLGRQQR